MPLCNSRLTNRKDSAIGIGSREMIALLQQFTHLSIIYSSAMLPSLSPITSYRTSNPPCFHLWCRQGPPVLLVLGRHSRVEWLLFWWAHWHVLGRRPDHGPQALTSVWVQSRWLNCRGPSCSLHWTEINCRGRNERERVDMSNKTDNSQQRVNCKKEESLALPAQSFKFDLMWQECLEAT